MLYDDNQRPVSDEEIIVRARTIQDRRKNELRLKSFRDAKTITIRWDIPGAPFGESYCGFSVSPDLLITIAEDHYLKLIGEAK